MAGITPIIAHPEGRYKPVQENSEFLTNWLEGRLCYPS